MTWPVVDLLAELRKERDRSDDERVLAGARTVLREAETADRELSQRIAVGSGRTRKPDLISIPDDEMVFPLEAIRKTCIAYRLRFLPSSRYRAPVPYEAFVRIRELERANDTRFEEFYIMAPAPAFHLEQKTDPVLFVPAGGDRFLLVHRWGGELSPWRKFAALPLRSIQSLGVTVVVFAFLVAAALPASWLSWNEELAHRTYSIRMFVFFMLVLGAVFGGILLHIRKNKNVSEDNWDSTLW